MSTKFIQRDRGTPFLLPPSVEVWLLEGHLARFVVEIVGCPHSGDRVNLTDADSRIMPVYGGGFEQGYNVQAVAGTTSKLIVSAHVTQQPNDKLEMEPTLEHLAALPEELGTVTDLITDSGSFSEANVTACEKQGLTPFIASGRKKHNEPIGDRFQEPPPLPDNADAVTRMKHRLRTTGQSHLRITRDDVGTGLRHRQVGHGIPKFFTAWF